MGSCLPPYTLAILPLPTQRIEYHPTGRLDQSNSLPRELNLRAQKIGNLEAGNHFLKPGSQVHLINKTRTDILGSRGKEGVLVSGQRYENRADEKRKTEMIKLSCLVPYSCSQFWSHVFSGSIFFVLRFGIISLYTCYISLFPLFPRAS